MKTETAKTETPVLTRETILSAIASGDYEIEHEQDCNCSFDWHVDQGTLSDGCDGNECWEGNILYVAGESIAQHVRYESREMLTKLINEDDIPDEIWSKMCMSDMCERGDSVNCQRHEDRRREALVDWLMDQDEYELDEDDERGFANEYVMILRRSDKPEDITREQAVKWADAYLYAGDAATEAYVGVRIED
jgi:hypothetical protein